MELNLCACGCGSLVKFKFKKGHGRRGKKNSLEHNKRISGANKGRIMSETQKEALRNSHIGKKVSEETRRRISEGAKAAGVGKWMSGRELSEDTKAKLKKVHTGRIVSKETREKISSAKQGAANGMYGKCHTDETKAIIAEASINSWINNREKYDRANKSSDKKAKLKMARARMIFPKRDTVPEVILATLLTSLSIEFIQHKYIKEIDNSYQCDFFLPALNLVLEADGLYWHNYPELRPIDKSRISELESVGFRVLRLWEHEIDKLTPSLLQKLLNTLDKSFLETIPLTHKFKRFEVKYGLK